MSDASMILKRRVCLGMPVVWVVVVCSHRGAYAVGLERNADGTPIDRERLIAVAVSNHHDAAGCECTRALRLRYCTRPLVEADR